MLGVALPLAMQVWDRRRLSPEQRAVCWNGATWGAAIYAFGPLSMLGWCWVTRGSSRARPRRRFGRVLRTLSALGLGVATAALLSFTIAAADRALGLVLGAAD